MIFLEKLSDRGKCKERNSGNFPWIHSTPKTIWKSTRKTLRERQRGNNMKIPIDSNELKDISGNKKIIRNSKCIRK